MRMRTLGLTALLILVPVAALGGLINTSARCTSGADCDIDARLASSLRLQVDNDLQVINGSTGAVTLDFRDYADTADDDMAHAIVTVNCTTATTTAEDCDLSIGVVEAGAAADNRIVIDADSGVDIGSATNADFTVTTTTSSMDLESTTANTLTLTAATTGTAIFQGADAAGASNTQLDTTGAGTITIGSADVTGVTHTTDGASLNLEGTTAETLTLTATTTNTAIFQGADAAGASNTLLDTTGAGSVDIGSADVLDVTIIADTDVQIQNGATGVVTLDLRDYADTDDDDMAHSLFSTNCGTTGTGAEECDLNVSITTAGANVEVLAMDPAGGIEIGDATTTAVTITTDGGSAVIDGSVVAQQSVVSLASGALTLNTVHLATAGAADYDIPDSACDAAADVGNWVTVVLEDASVVVSITSDDASNIIYVPGLGLGAGDELDSVSTAAHEGQHITLTCLAAEGWYMTGGNLLTSAGAIAWADGGVAD